MVKDDTDSTEKEINKAEGNLENTEKQATVEQEELSRQEKIDAGIDLTEEEQAAEDAY